MGQKVSKTDAAQSKEGERTDSVSSTLTMGFEETLASKSDLWLKFVREQEGLNTEKKRKDAWKEAQTIIKRGDDEQDNIFTLLKILIEKTYKTSDYSRPLYGPADFALTFESVFEEPQFIEMLETFINTSIIALVDQSKTIGQQLNSYARNTELKALQDTLA